VLPPNAGDALKDFQRLCKQTRVSAELSATLQLQQPTEERLQSATELLLADAARHGGSLIDLSHRVEGKGSLLMLLIEMLVSIEPVRQGKDPVAQAKRDQLGDAWEACAPALEHTYALIRSSYDTSIQRPDGKDALGLLASSVIPCDTSI
jgi:hypothetical protein